jgi:lipoprotein-anchoring transpeptidase ErfK/SrfK
MRKIEILLSFFRISFWQKFVPFVFLLTFTTFLVVGCSHEQEQTQPAKPTTKPKTETIHSNKVAESSTPIDKETSEEVNNNLPETNETEETASEVAVTENDQPNWNQQVTQKKTTTDSVYQIEINKQTNQLFLYQHGEIIRTYPVATGKDSWRTPEGTFPIIVKFINPGWKEIVGGAPENPLGSRWNGLQVNGDNGRTYGIHGTNNDQSIGTYASNGCIRMYNADVIELYDLVPIGTPVWIHSGYSDGTWRGDSY